jgi:hypothetical protein
MVKDKVNFEELPIEVQMRHVFGNYKRQIQEGILYDILTEFYFADWTRKCDYDKMTSEEVVEAAIAVCKKIEEKYNYSLDDEFRVRGCFEDKDWAEDFT